MRNKSKLLILFALSSLMLSGCITGHALTQKHSDTKYAFLNTNWYKALSGSEKAAMHRVVFESPCLSMEGGRNYRNALLMSSADILTQAAYQRRIPLGAVEDAIQEAQPEICKRERAKVEAREKERKAREAEAKAREIAKEEARKARKAQAQKEKAQAQKEEAEDELLSTLFTSP